MKKLLSAILTFVLIISSFTISYSEPKIYKSEFLPEGKFIFTTYGYHDTWTNEWKGWGESYILMCNKLLIYK